MGGIALANAARLQSDTGLFHTPDSVANLEQEPTVYEMGNALMSGEYGGLDFLFGEHPLASVPTPLETIETPGISPALLSRMQNAAEITSTYSYQPRADQVPGGPVSNVGPAGEQPSAPAWTFSDTLKREVERLQELIAKALNRGASG